MACDGMRRRIAIGSLAAAIALQAVPFAAAQPGRDNYYRGMQQNVQRGNYDRRYNHGDRGRYDNHKGGGIGPGYGALIGAGGGAALGAIFGGGLKGTLIGGAAGAGLGALGGKLAQGNNNNDHDRYHH